MMTWRTLGPASVALFLLLAVAYSFSVGLRASYSAVITGDEPFYLLTTQSLIDDQNLDLREQYERESYRSFFDHPDGLWKQSRGSLGEPTMSPHEPGLSVLLIPGFAAGGLRGAQAELLLIAAVTFVLAFLLAALETGKVMLAWVLTAVIGLSAPAFVYSTEIYPEIPTAGLLLLGLLILRSRPALRRSVALALCLSALAWMGIKYLPLAAVLGAFFAMQSPNRERFHFAAVAAPMAAVYVLAHLAWFGALTPYSGNSVYDGASAAAVVESHFSFGDRVYRIWGLFVDERFGLGHWAPLTLAIPPGLPLLFRGRIQSLAGALIGVQLLVATFLAVTMMGWSFPGRHLMVVVPLFALALTVIVSRLPGLLAPVWLALGVYTLATTAALANAGLRGEIRVSVDPFELDSPIFAALSHIFPDYRWWTAETQVLNAVWLVTFLALAFGAMLVAWRQSNFSLAELRCSGKARMRRFRAFHSRPGGIVAHEDSR